MFLEHLMFFSTIKLVPTRRHPSQAPMHPAIVVKIHVAVNGFISLRKGFKLRNGEQIALQQAVKEFNISVHVGGPSRNPFVLDPEALAQVPKKIAYKLWSVVRMDRRHGFAWPNPFPNGPKQRLTGVPGVTDSPAVIIHDDPVKHINDAQNEEESVFPGHVPILDVHLLQLVGTGPQSVLGQPARVLGALFPLGFQQAQFFAEAVDLFLVQHQALFFGRHSASRL